MSDNSLAGTYNRYITYSSSSDTPDYYSDLLNRINNILNWQADIDNRFEALYDMVSKFSEAEIDNTINTKVTNAINELINDLNGELDRKLEKPNIKAGTNISLTKDANSNDITINDTINLNGYATKTYVTKMNKTNNKIQRKFKPSIGNFLDLNPGGGQMISEDKIDKALSKCKEHGIEKIVIQPWVTWNNSTSTLTLKNDLDRLKYIEEKCLEVGLEVACLKLHMYLINFSNVSDKAAFKNQYKNIVQLLCNKFSNSSVNLFIPFNECYVFYKKDSEHLEFTNEVLDIVKSSNFKCGISTMGGRETVGMDSTLKDKVDVFCINSYPKISYKKERTTLEDSISAWNNSYELKCYKEMKRQYPFKDIIMSETGCNDQWICLANPGNWNLSESYNTNGKAPALMLEGLFNSDFKDLIKSVWWCYHPTILNEECKNIIERYTGGKYEL